MVKFGAVFKKWWNGPHKGFVRYAVGITAIALVYATFFSADSLVDWGRAYLELRQQRRQIERPLHKPRCLPRSRDKQNSLTYIL